MFQAGDTIGPYTLIRRLGRGTFGIVWLAEKKSPVLTKTVALKVPHEDEVDLEAVRREASIWEHAGGHPNILPILDADIYDEHVAIVSEYAPDGSLSNWLARHEGKAPDTRTAAEMTLGILAGLIHLHSRNIVHRDLKPDNILLSGEIPRLADFGIARILKNTGSFTTNISGTPVYMAPEAFKGRRSEQTDIWSAGVILYQLLTGSLPYPQTDAPSLMYAVCNEEPQRLPAEIPETLRMILSKALRKAPDERYRTALEMRGALKRFLSASNVLTDKTLTQTPRDSFTFRGAKLLFSDEQTIPQQPTKLEMLIGPKFSRDFNEMLRNYQSGKSIYSGRITREQVISIFWHAFASRVKWRQIPFNLGKRGIGESGMSWRRTKLRQGVFVMVELNSTKHYIDVSVTIGSQFRALFAALEAHRRDIEKKLGHSLEWKVKSDGERCIFVRRDFYLGRLETWLKTCDWLINNLIAFYNEFPSIIASMEAANKKQGELLRRFGTLPHIK